MKIKNVQTKMMVVQAVIYALGGIGFLLNGVLDKLGEQEMEDYINETIDKRFALEEKKKEEAND